MSLARGLMTQAEVVRALILRETRTRFGKNHLGYLWALFEPLLIILTFYTLFSVAGRTTPTGMTLFSFIGTGFVPYLMFRNTADRVAQSIDGNKALLFYPHVQPLDLALARGLLESATTAGVFVMLMGVHALYVQDLAIDDLLLVIAGFALAGLLGMAAGLLFCGLGQLSTAVNRVRGPLMRPLFWTSGIFFTAAELPSGARDVLLYNPVLHPVELVREGWFPSYTASHADPVYVIKWILLLGLAGLMLERAVRRRIEVT